MPDVNGIDYSKDPRFTTPKPNGIDYSKDPRFSKPEVDIPQKGDRIPPHRNLDPNSGDIEITPEDHFVRDQNAEMRKRDEAILRAESRSFQSPIDYSEERHLYKKMDRNDPYGNKSSLFETKAHTIADYNAWGNPKERELAKERTGFMVNKDGEIGRVFAGSATLVNPTLDIDDPEFKHREKILRMGDGFVEDEMSYSGIARTSPFQPFTRMDPYIARKTNLISYNRTHTPIADLEFRKCFRHIFITRPECYIMCNEGGLSDQAKYDDDFASIYSRMPHILEILSPRYLASHSILSSDGLKSNWNFLLSNRAMGLTFEPIENSTTEGAKTTHNFTVSTANAQTSQKEGSITITFRDTKYFEIYEMIRMWMLYMHKRHIGVFAPPFNGYKQHNDFDVGTSAAGKIYLHPYDRAIEYPCTIFDIVTDETDSRILHYCAYIGAYPYQMSLPLNNDQNGAITSEMKVSVGFKYSAKIINNNRTLINFNYNAGLTDDIGRPTQFTQEVLPFLLNDSRFESSNPSMIDYIGQSSLFTGSPYIVMGQSHANPVNRGGSLLVSPYLKFAPINLADINIHANNDIVHEVTQTTGSVTGINIGNSSNAQYNMSPYMDTIKNVNAGEYNEPVDSDDAPLETPSLEGVMNEIKENNANASEAMKIFMDRQYWFWYI